MFYHEKTSVRFNFRNQKLFYCYYSWNRNIDIEKETLVFNVVSVCASYLITEAGLGNWNESLLMHTRHQFRLTPLCASSNELASSV